MPADLSKGLITAIENMSKVNMSSKTLQGLHISDNVRLLFINKQQKACLFIE